MKRAGIIVASTALLVVMALATIVAVRGSRRPDTGEVTCPMYLPSSLAHDLGASYRPERWEVYSFDGQKGAPTVQVRPSSVVPDRHRNKSCELKILWAPQEPGSGSDWRIGHIVANPAPLRGRTVAFRVQMKADPALVFDSAYIYIWDGPNWTTAPIKRVGAEWQTVQASHTLAPDATAFEVWIRLVFDKGTIRPGSGRLYFVASLDPQPH